MKRLLVLTAAVCCLGAAAPANYNAFGIAVLQRLAGQSHAENVFLSPVSLGIALAMAADGAAGSTRTAILHALALRATEVAPANAALIASLESNSDARVGIANAIWLRQDIPPSSRYVALLRRGYRAEARAVHFGDPSAAQAINAWTRAHTLGLIDHIVDSTSPMDFAYLTNALAFKADWTAPFDRGETSRQPFTDADGTKHDVQMMMQRATFRTADLPTLRVLRLPYGKNGGYAAYILLPNGKDAAALVRGLSASAFDHALRALRAEDVRVGLPRFTAEYQAQLEPLLEAMGMGVAFSRNADFSPMHPPAGTIRLGSVVHKTYVRVDEQGTTAAAATSVEMRMTSVMMPPARTFIVDHPFVMALRDERTGALLFIGVINTVPHT
ncbi:MAG: serpin family protein [Candidatus Tyrphobacter sp.]